MAKKKQKVSRQTRWARNVYSGLIELLGNVCEFCGAKRKLELDHIYGCEWAEIRPKIGYVRKASLYLRDAAEGKLRVLCRSCNAKIAVQEDKRILDRIKVYWKEKRAEKINSETEPF